MALVTRSASKRVAALFLGVLAVTLLALLGDFPGSGPASANPATGVLHVSFGSAQACLVNASGGVECWGQNVPGEGGYRNSPTAVAGLANGVTAIAAGGTHNCALLATGSVNCWGNNDLGQAGHDGALSFVGPGSVAGLGTATAITAGEAHSCAVLSSANLSCWGLNSSDQLGAPSGDNCGGIAFFTACSLTPIAVTSLAGSVAQASAGALHTCAVTTSGGAKCWGSNSFGQLGDGTTVDRLTPADVTGLTSGAVQVAAGGQHNCVLTSGGGVMCWGLNQFGQLGDGSTVSSSAPVDVTGISSGVAAVFVGSNHSCALMSVGTIKCWGSNDDGALGNGTTVNRPLPVEVISISGSTFGAAGLLGTCALLSGGSLWCWGRTAFVGDGTWLYRTSPTHIKGLSSGVADVSVGAGHACALTTTGAAKCWGTNSHGQLGDGTTISRSVPADVSGLSSGVVAISAGDGYACAVTTTGTVKCWGAFPTGGCKFTPCLTPATVAGISPPVVDVTAGGGPPMGDTPPTIIAGYTCALSKAGGVKCWEEFSGPADIPGLTSGVASVSAGASHTCAVFTSGDVQCWGDNSSGQLGDGTTTDSAVPVAGLSGVDIVSAGDRHTCAVTTTSDVQCWGANDVGQLGAVSSEFCALPVFVDCSTTPLDVVGLAGVGAGVSAGDLHTCAVTLSGGVKCWGDNGSGQLGDGSLVDSPVPVDVMHSASGFEKVSVGGSSSCALTVAGRVECWGQTLGPDDRFQTVPVQVVAVTVKPIPTQTPCGPQGCPTPTDTPTASPTPLPTDTPIPGDEPAMALAVLDAAGAEVCHSDESAKCEISLGSAFRLVVDILRAPAAGYVLAQTWVDFGLDLTYKPTDAAAEELTWPDCLTAVALRSQLSVTSVLHGCFTGLLPPLPASDYTGIMVDLSMNCSPGESSTEVQLLPEGDPVAGTSGALFAVTFGQNVVPRVGLLTINCVDVAPVAVGGVALGGELRGIAAQDGTAPWLWAALGFGAIAALGALAVARRQRAASR